MRGRYISHVEDKPMAWGKAFHDPSEAIKATYDLVLNRAQTNGNGAGAVLDSASNQIIALMEDGPRGWPDDPDIGVDFLPLPKGDEHARMVAVIRGFHDGTAGGDVAYLR